MVGDVATTNADKFRSMRAPALTVLCLASLTLSSAAQAQNIFELLFGRPPQPVQPVPPGSIGAPRAPAPNGAVRPGGPEEGPAAPSAAPYVPAPPKPVVLKVPTEEGVVGRDLKLNGAGGNLRIERSARGDYTARLTLAGAKVAQPTEACTAAVGGEAGLPLASLGRPDGVPRYELQAPSCPIQLDVLEGGVLVKSPVEACVIAEAGCRAEVAGMWGPEPNGLLSRARDLEQARGAADRAVRENYKALTQRAKPGEVRAIVSEQAAFSSEREQICRSYAREPGHGFCNTRFTEARGLLLVARLGLNAAPQATADGRPRRLRPTSELVEQAPLEPPAGRTQ